jgi:hypothetical protein
VVLLEQKDVWSVQRARYMTLETIAPLSDDPAVSLPAIAGSVRPTPVNAVPHRQLHHFQARDQLAPVAARWGAMRADAPE